MALEAPHEPVELVILNYKKDGTPFWNLLNIVPIMDDVGQVKAFLGTQEDVTAIVELVESNAASADENVVDAKESTFNKLFCLPRRERTEQYLRLTSPAPPPRATRTAPPPVPSHGNEKVAPPPPPARLYQLPLGQE